LRAAKTCAHKVIRADNPPPAGLSALPARIRRTQAFARPRRLRLPLNSDGANKIEYGNEHYRLDHLVLTVNDIEATCSFYKRVLGMEVVVFGGGGKPYLLERKKSTCTKR